MNIQPILWKNLRSTKQNVRTIKAETAELEANIASVGLLQNLIVVPSKDEGFFDVIGGERRRRAIGNLIAVQKWDADKPVMCVVREAEDVTSVSFSENAQRAEMHPADAIRAFKAMRDEGQADTAIAHRFGYEIARVRRFLALADLSPKVIAALAKDKIDLSAAKAFTIVSDHARQELVLKAGACNAHAIRRALSSDKVASTDRRYRFVGAEAFEAAGGTFTHDLFSTEENGGYINEPELLDELCMNKLDALEVESRAQGWGDVRCGMDRPYDYYNWNRDDRGQAIPAEERGRYRYVVSIDSDGNIRGETFSIQRLREVKTDESGKRIVIERPLYSQANVDDLTLIRTTALQSEVAKNPSVAFAVLLDSLLPLVSEVWPKDHAVQLRAVNGGIKEATPSHPMNRMDMGTPFGPVADLMAEKPSGAGSRLDWLLSLDMDTQTRLLAAVTGGLLDATDAKYASVERLKSANRIARAVNLDMNEHWEGNVDFYSSLSKKALLSALTEVHGAAKADSLAKLSRADLAVETAELLAGSNWLPEPLVTPAAEIKEEADEIGDAEEDGCAVDESRNDNEDREAA